MYSDGSRADRTVAKVGKHEESQSEKSRRRCAEDVEYHHVWGTEGIENYKIDHRKPIS